MEYLSLEGLPFGDLVKAFRKRQKIRQQKLAELLGKHVNTIGTWERGECLPHAKCMVLELAKALHLNDQETRLLFEASLTAPAPYWYVPCQRNLLFTGREDVLKTVYTHLYPHQGQLTRATRSYALRGLGGVGKTQLAAEYAYRHALEYQAIFWIGAESAETIISSFRLIAEQLHLPERQGADPQRIVEAVHRWLVFRSQWLLIWDDVKDLELLQQFLPPTLQGAHLITTHRQTLGTIAPTLEVLPMSGDEGALLLLRRAKILPPQAVEAQMQQFATTEPVEYAAAQELVLLMGGLPLALDQVGAYIDETGCSVSDYLQRYRQQQMQLLNRRGTSGGSHSRSVTTTFMLAIQRLKLEHPAAVNLLYLCAFLYPDAIPEELFIEGAAYLAAQSVSPEKDLFSLDEALAALGTYSLLQRQLTERVFSVHQLVQVVIQESLADAERRLWVERTIQVVNAVFPHAESGSWLRCERLLPQALVAIQMSERYEVVTKEVDRLLYETAYYLQHRGGHTEAEIPYNIVGHLSNCRLLSRSQQLAVLKTA
ncbi:MAG TPA: NB-ARC domain-containing protein [Ktedonosporobacter sp.]|jgi:transcriptional regulator with XRE-family HTH domain|nr:NB-ARC domain-containing protein [Ktedonosporobacter sp.]